MSVGSWTWYSAALAALLFGCAAGGGRSKSKDSTSTTAGDAADASVIAPADAPAVPRDTPGADTAGEGGDAAEVSIGDDTAPPTDGGGCVPQCEGKECGLNGCGGQCGTCPGGGLCVDGSCTCVANCSNKDCGSDGCGGDCGPCAPGLVCNTTLFECEAECTPACAGKSCGSNGCGGDCGTCGPGQSCNAFGTCVADCTPSCLGKECGDDGCGKSCGTCGFGLSCSQGVCVSDCTPSCFGKECGDDGCGESCGTCGFGLSCSQNACVSDCTPSCFGKECGDDGCGEPCGTCGFQETCSATGQCEPDCTPDCVFKECGADGCGDTCGECGFGELCDAGLCAADCAPQCAGKECGPDGCGDTCGACGVAESCQAGTCVSGPVGQGDTCGAAFVIGALPYSTSGDTTGANDDYGYGANVCPGETSSWGAGAVDQAWELTAPLTGDYTITLTTVSFDSNLYVVTDCSNVDGTCLVADEQVCSSCTEQVSLPLDAGTKVFIIVDGYGGGEAGSYDLSVVAQGGCTPQCVGKECGGNGCGATCGTCPAGESCSAGQCLGLPPAPGDVCGNALPIGSLPFTTIGDTSTAHHDYSFPAGVCPGEQSAKGGASADLAYSFTAPKGGGYLFRITPETWGSVLYVVSSCANIAGTCLAADDEICSDCEEAVALAMTAGQTVFVIVDGWSDLENEAGAFTLTVEEIEAPPPAGELVINEVLADPAAGTIEGDANCDGVRDSGDDEFVELVNASNASMDLGGVTISDGLSPRHTFPAGTTLPPGGVMLVFGGGDPFTVVTGAAWCGATPGNVQVQTATGGGLNLNNGGDAVTISPMIGVPLAVFSYGTTVAGDQDQSMVRSPELSGPHVLHGGVPGSIGAQSPGRTTLGGAITPP